jgi:hypothetical protein
MIRHFTEEGRDLVLLKLAMENNAFLRTVLSNQLLIMQAFQIDRRLPVPFHEEIIDDVGNPDREFREYLLAVEAISRDVMRKMWDYAVEHDSSLDRPGDLGV